MPIREMQRHQSVQVFQPPLGGLQPGKIPAPLVVTVEHQVAEGRQLPHDGVRHIPRRQNPLYADRLQQGVGEHPVVEIGRAHV